MIRSICAAATMALLAACGSFSGTVATDPARTVLGIAADQPRADPPAVLPGTARVLTYKESQICTRGYSPVRQEIEPGTDDRAFVDWQLRCKPYHFALLGVDLAAVSSDAGSVPAKLKSLLPF